MGRIKRYWLIIIGVLLIQEINAQTNTNFCYMSKLIFEEINSIHYRQMEMNDAWSKKVWSHFISEIDPQGLYLTYDDYKLITAYNDSIDDYIQSSNCQFFLAFLDLFKKRIIGADFIVKQLLKKPLTFSKNDTLVIFKDNQTVFAKDNNELVSRWNNYLKYRALLYLLSGTDTLSSNKSLSLVKT